MLSVTRWLDHLRRLLLLLPTSGDRVVRELALRFADPLIPRHLAPQIRAIIASALEREFPSRRLEAEREEEADPLPRKESESGVAAERQLDSTSDVPLLSVSHVKRL